MNVVDPSIVAMGFRNPLDQAPVPQWVSDMVNHFCEHGYYRAEDIHRAFGDPMKATAIGVSPVLVTVEVTSNSD
jgi:hypothetical protein